MLKILSLPTDIQQEGGCTQLSLSYDSMIRIARLEKDPQQRELIGAMLAGANQKDIRGRIDEMKGKTKIASTVIPSTTPKPKRVFHTNFKATIIVQSTTTRLTGDQTIAALKEAISQASDHA